MLDPRLADELRVRPAGKRAMVQTWRSLTFIHYAFDPEIVQATLPSVLTVDTFPDASGEEKAWVGVVPFRMREVSFNHGVRVPTTVNFLETNVRTYVHREGREPGVWFYSLDAESFLASQTARVWYGLPYWHAWMSYREDGVVRVYQGRRYSKSRPEYRIEIEVGEELPNSLPGSLEFFLAERYLLYSQYRGRLRIGRVIHRPYPLQRAILRVCEDELTPSAGFPKNHPVSVLYSPGVEVDVFPLR